MSLENHPKSADLNPEVLARALDAVKCGVLITDPNKLDNPIVYANPEFCEMTGYSLCEILGKNCRFLQARDRVQPELDEVRLALRNGTSCTVTVRNYRKNGELFYNELTISPVINPAKEITYFVGIQKDVTAEVVLKQQQGEFVATLLHDVKTPLLADVRLLDYIASTESEIGESMSLIEALAQNDKSLIRLIENAIDCYRLESTEMEVALSHFELLPQLVKCVENLNFVAKQKSVKVIVFNEQVELSADLRLSMRVLSNLLELGIKYAPAKGRITVKMRDKKNMVDIEIASRSSQMPGRFLNLKQQLVLSHSDENSTEIALYLSKKILEKHGGSLLVVRKNKVTTFIARFPKCARDADAS